MITTKEPFYRSLYRHSSKLLSRLVMFAGIVILAATLIGCDLWLRRDLVKATETAHTKMKDLFVTYDASSRYTEEEILELTSSEINAIALHERPVFLQTHNTNLAIYYDSRTKSLGQYDHQNMISLTPRYGNVRGGHPLLYMDLDLADNGKWIIRGGIEWKDYLLRYILLAFLIIPPCGLLITGFQALGEAYRRRRFDQFVASMINILRHTDEETLIIAAPEIIATMLDFDAVGVYLREGDRIAPRGAYLPQGHREAFLESTDEEPITIDSEYPEARVMRGEATTLVVDLEKSKPIHQKKLERSGNCPYVIALMRSDEQQKPIGLLSAQHHRGLQPEHEDFLRVAAQILALLIERFRGRESQERMYQQMIRNTRTMSIGTMVPYVAHNIRTPLTIIGQLTKSLRRNLPRDIDADTPEMLNDIKSQVDICFELLQSVSNYTEPEAAQRKSVRVVASLKEHCVLFKQYLAIKGITLELQCLSDNAEDAIITMDDLDFVQIIDNLLKNADEAFSDIKRDVHQPSKRSFRIDLSVQFREIDSSVVIVVEDNGPGISPENLERVFDESFTTKGRAGSGVGLGYCRQVIEQARGTLTAESQDRGARFTIVIPARLQ